MCVVVVWLGKQTWKNRLSITEDRKSKERGVRRKRSPARSNKLWDGDPEPFLRFWFPIPFRQLVSQDRNLITDGSSTYPTFRTTISKKQCFNAFIPWVYNIWKCYRMAPHYMQPATEALKGISLKNTDLWKVFLLWIGCFSAGLISTGNLDTFWHLL